MEFRRPQIFAPTDYTVVFPNLVASWIALLILINYFVGTIPTEAVLMQWVHMVPGRFMPEGSKQDF